MDEVLQIVVELWKYDLEVMSQAWMYYCALIPATAYFAFMFLKWTAITMPIWIPLSRIFGKIKIFGRYK